MTLFDTMRRLLAVSGLATLVVAASIGVGSAHAAAPTGQQAVASVSPAAGDVVGVAAPVTVTFAGSVPDRAAAQRSLRFTSGGAPSGRFSWPADDVMQWTPDGFFPAHSTVALSVGGVKTNFRTGAEVLGVADIDAHTFTVSIDGVVAREMPASMGKPKFPTPIGTFSALEKQNVVVMDSRTIGIPLSDAEGYKLTVYDAVRVTWGGVYVHGAPWSTGSQGNSNVSHGCINLSADNAAWYYDQVSVGDPIIVRA
ncbi:L,D-transpeptidase [Mycolicibacterium grossiae]|uniref:L,D-TPase catalytic domain-containing protein n=1 Tax=Mycolicibacterium grossiae TaxID=1552759 RepID=A0A1E8PVY0_9MYCO|nr:L,D-transpeptidase [Mycolicibacterium grossiae]OFJ50361.1 hypothetical protein BEL07_28680 [Mycolicibacterium grossiae]QEM46811.1 L,D-transpeptidase [Mycolicibacterium grossiae]